MTSPISELSAQIASLQQQVNDLRSTKVIYVRAPVVSVNTGASTFGATIPNPTDGTLVTLSGIASPPAFLPHVGDTVTLALSGPHILFQPGGIGDGVVGSTQIANAAVGTPQLAPGAVTSTILGSAVAGQISTAQSTASTALTTANGKNTVTYSTLTPTGSGVTVGDIWFQLSSTVVVGSWEWTGAVWQSTTFGDQVLNTLTAAKITTGTLAAGQTISAGALTGSHSTLDASGFHCFLNSVNDGVVEVGRLGTGANDFLGIGDSSGNLVGAWDDTGYVSASGANFTGDIVVDGYSLLTSMASAVNSGAGNPQIPGGVTGVSVANPTASGITSEVGLIEKAVNVRNDRTYLIAHEVSVQRSTAATEVRIRLRDGGTSAPTLTSPMISYRQYSHMNPGMSMDMQSFGIWQPATTGSHRILMSIEAVGGGTAEVDIVNGAGTGLPLSSIMCMDMGPSFNTSNAQINQITGGGTGGATGAPPSQHFTELTPTSSSTFRGNDTLRTDTTDIVQGWDPSGFNGDGYGFVGFGLPSITGTVDRVDLVVPWNWTYFNSGGTLLLTPLHSGTASPYSSFTSLMMASQQSYAVAGKSGTLTVTLPSAWWPKFANASSPRASFIGFGHSGGTNETFYVRVTAAGCRLRIWYTQ